MNEYSLAKVQIYNKCFIYSLIAKLECKDNHNFCYYQETNRKKSPLAHQL